VLRLDQQPNSKARSFFHGEKGTGGLSPSPVRDKASQPGRKGIICSIFWTGAARRSCGPRFRNRTCSGARIVTDHSSE
jgi:hypothetical protein